jgi:hypothetical protein
MAHNELDVFLAKIQTTRGTAETGLVSTNFATFGATSTLETLFDLAPLEYASGTFGQEQGVVGAARCPITIEVPVIPTASSTEPFVGGFFKACGMEVVTATNLHTYSPSSTPANWKDFTIWKYSGDKASGASLLAKASSCMFNVVLTGKLGGPLMAKFTGLGCCPEVPAAASYVSGTLTLPSVPPAIIKTTTCTILGTSLKCIEFEWDMGNEVVLVPDPSKDYGYLWADIGKRQSKFKAKVVQESHATYNPFTNLAAGTLATTTITFGVTGSKITLASGASKSQIVACPESDEGGIKLYDLEANLIDNSWSIAVNVT